MNERVERGGEEELEKEKEKEEKDSRSISGKTGIVESVRAKSEDKERKEGKKKKSGLIRNGFTLLVPPPGMNPVLKDNWQKVVQLRSSRSRPLLLPRLPSCRGPAKPTFGLVVSRGCLTWNSPRIQMWLKREREARLVKKKRNIAVISASGLYTHSDGKCALGNPTTLSRYDLSTSPNKPVTARVLESYQI